MDRPSGRAYGTSAVGKRWTQRPEGSTWGEWGDDDELGRVNLITPEKVLQGAREIQAGISFCLSLPLDYPGGTALNQRRHPPRPAGTEPIVRVIAEAPTREGAAELVEALRAALPE